MQLAHYSFWNILHVRVNAGALVNCLAAANQEVPKDLVELANRDASFRKAGGRGRGGARGGRGRGRSQVGLPYLLI